MKKTIITLALVLLFFSTRLTNAQVAVESSASLMGKSVGEGIDMREVILRQYLESHNSQLAAYSAVFIKYADEYNIDWRLVPAITGVESTFGKRIPYNSYNVYGWANGEYIFSSWDESIKIVTKALSEKYIARGANTTAEIGRIYAPPSSTWAKNVDFFKNKTPGYFLIKMF